MLSIKQTIYHKLRNSNGNSSSFISYVCYFAYDPSAAASKVQSLTLFSTKMRGLNTVTRTINSQHPCPILLEFCHSSPPFCKNHKKPCETLTLTEGFVFSSCRYSKQSLFWWGCFQTSSGNNNTSLLLYACKVIYLINNFDFTVCSQVGWNTFKV